MKKLVTIAVVLVALIWMVGRLRYALASPEERIRITLDRMVLGFNTTKMAGVLGGFARDYRDEGAHIDRERVREILLYLFFREIDPTTKEFRLRVEVPESELAIEVDANDETRATSHMRAVFYERSGGEESLYWDARVTADWAEGEDGWQMLRTRDVNHSDRRRN